MDFVLEDLKKTLLETSRENAYFLCGRISRAMEKNRFGLFYDRDDELTALGEVVGGLFEVLFIFGVLKWRYDNDGIS